MQIASPWRESSLVAVAALILAAFVRTSCGAYTDAKPLRFKGTFNPFKVVELPKSKELPSADALKKAFKKAALKWHPDRCKRKTPIEECEARMEEVKLAQEVLSDDRKLMQWEAWDEERRGVRPKDTGRTKPFGQPAGDSGFGSGSGFSGGGAFPGGDSPFANFGNNFGFEFGGGGDRPRKKQPKRPAPAPPPKKPEEKKRWKVISREPGAARHGADVEIVTRERDLPGTPMVQVEIVEVICYKAQVQCQESIVERKRRRREQEEM